jgi:hypothetical protein
MRRVIAIGCVAALTAGCAGHKGTAEAKAKAPVFTADFRPVGTVLLVNAAAKFVVISYAPGAIPEAGRRLAVYHKGLKTGQLKVTGPARDNNTVADILEGNAESHDEVREE